MVQPRLPEGFKDIDGKVVSEDQYRMLMILSASLIPLCDGHLEHLSKRFTGRAMSMLTELEVLGLAKRVQYAGEERWTATVASTK